MRRPRSPGRQRPSVGKAIVRRLCDERRTANRSDRAETGRRERKRRRRQGSRRRRAAKPRAWMPGKHRDRALFRCVNATYFELDRVQRLAIASVDGSTVRISLKHRKDALSPRLLPNLMVHDYIASASRYECEVNVEDGLLANCIAT